MNLKLVMAVSLVAAVPMIAYAQNNDSTEKAPKPTMADAQKLVQMIGSDKAKLKAYCDIGKLQEQMEQADQKKDDKVVEALSTKVDSLTQQIGPEYAKFMDGLEEIDPDSAKGKRFGGVFDSLTKQCK